MKYSDLSKENIQYIENSIAEKLTKLGVVGVNVKVSSFVNYCNKEYIQFETSEFQTTPVIYKAVRCYGDGQICENEKSIDLYMQVNYGFKYFSGASNGVEIGLIHFAFYVRENEILVQCRGLNI